MALTNDDRLILLGLKEAPIATFKIGSPVTSDVIAKLYSNGLLEFEGSGDIVKFSNYSAPWNIYKSSITSISFKEGNTIQPTSTAYLFQSLNKVTSIDLSNLDTSNVIDMSKMFSSCNSLNIITGFENLDTSNVTDVSMMFEYCPSLISLDLSNFDIPKVTTTDFMFQACSNLSSSITIKNSNITSYSGMFAGCSTEPGSEFVVKYIDNDTKSIAEAMVATKYPENSNVFLRSGIVSKAYNIGYPVASDVTATLYDDGYLEFDGSGDTINHTDYTYPWSNDNIRYISFKKGNSIQPTNMIVWFSNVETMFSADLSNLDTSKVTDIQGMFNNCFSLRSIIGIENLNTSNVTNMNSTFNGCEALTSLDLSGWNTSKVTDMMAMFSYCVNLEILNLSNLDTSKVTDMMAMFDGCDSLTTIIGLEDFNTSNVTDMCNMFQSCTNLTSSITIMNSNITLYSNMFAGCSINNNTEFTVYYIDGCKTIAQNMVNTKDSNSNVVLYVEPAYLINGDDFFITTMSLTDNISSIQFSNEPPIDPTPGDILLVSEATSPVKAYMAQLATGGIIVYPEEAGSPLVANESCVGMFGMSTSISFDNFDTSLVTDMSYMFNSCDQLTSLDLSKFNTSNVTNMEGMFNACFSLDTITGLENLNTSNVTNMMDMFRDCNSLSSLDLSNWDTSNVTDMNTMFENCNSLSSLDLSNWDTSNVTDMRSMFSGCIGLHSLDLSSFDTSKVTNMSYMFETCSSLESLDLSSFDTSKVTNMDYMFNGCMNLLSSIIIRNPNIERYSSMCVGCGRTGTFVIHYITGCETIAQNMVDTKGTGLLAGRTFLGFNIDLITKDSSVSTEITPKIINIIADCAMKQWGYNNTLISIKSIKITYNDQTNLKWSLTYVSDPCEFVYNYTTKTYTCKQYPAQI